MSLARCVYEIYEVTCKCGEKYQALVEPQEIHAKTTGNTDKYQTAGVRCPKCKNLAVFLGPVARPVEITGEDF
jgi:Zn finger protein HypA/HybF involved in hydrogenase expression